MSRWFEDNPQSIGRTPLIRLNRITGNAGARVFAKIEGRNPACSVKCRIGAALIEDAALRWAHRPDHAGKTIVVLLPDSGERYLSSALFQGVFDAAGLPA